MSQTILFRTCVMLLALTCVSANVSKDVESRCNGPCFPERDEYCRNLAGDWYFKASLISGNEYTKESGLEYGAAVGTATVSVATTAEPECGFDVDGIAISLEELNRDNVIQKGTLNTFSPRGSKFLVSGLSLACQVVQNHVKFVCVSPTLFPAGNLSKLSPYGTYQWTFERGETIVPDYCPPAPSPSPTPFVPSPFFPSPAFPSPSFPSPSFPSPSFPSPSFPSPSFPSPSFPSPSFPSPSFPSPSFPSPSFPSPSFPTPSSPTPDVFMPSPSFMTGSPEVLIPLEPDNASDDDLTDGEIAAIVIASTLAGLALLAGLAFLLFALLGGGSQVFQGAGPSMLRENAEG